MSENEAELTLTVTLDVGDVGDVGDIDDATVLITVAGEIDSSNCDRLQTLLSEQARAGELRVDLGGVSFIDSSGLRALLVGQQAVMSAAGTLRVVNPSDNVRRLFEITGLTERLGTS